MKYLALIFFTVSFPEDADDNRDEMGEVVFYVDHTIWSCKWHPTRFEIGKLPYIWLSEIFSTHFSFIVIPFLEDADDDTDEMGEAIFLTFFSLTIWANSFNSQVFKRLWL